MGNSCKYTPPMVNIKGSDAQAESKLWKGLMTTFGNDRNIVKAIYKISQDSQFRKEKGFDKEENQDENGEPKEQKLLEELGLNKSEKNTILKFLTKDLCGNSSNILSYSEAIDKITQWNSKTDEYKDGYLAVFTKEGKDKYRIYVTKDTIHSRKKLFKSVRDKELSDRFKLYLQSKGATFTKEGDDNYSEDSINGFFNLIKISKDEDFDESLAFQSGLFAVQAMSDNPLIERLNTLLSPEVRQQLQTQYGIIPITTEEMVVKEGNNETTINISTRREAAGFLVGQAFLNNLDTKNWIHNLAYKASRAIKRFFYKFQGDEGAKKRIMLEAESVARQIAQEFSSWEMIKHEEKLPEIDLDLQLTPEKLTYENIVRQIKISLKKLSNIEPSLANDLKNFTDQYLLSTDFKEDDEGRQLDDATKRAMLLDRIAEAMQHVFETLDRGVSESLDKLKGMDNFSLDNTEEWVANYRNNSRALVTAHENLELANCVLEEVNSLISVLNTDETIPVKLRNSRKIERDLKSLRNDLSATVSSLTGHLLNKEVKFFTQFLTLVEGGEQIAHSARILWKSNASLREINATLGTKKEKKKELKGSIYAVKDNTQAVGELLSMKSDISLFSAWIASMSNNEDTVGVLLDKAVKNKQKEADDKNFKDADTILKLKDEGEALGLSSDLHEIIEWEDEVDKSGVLTGRKIPTGNFIQEYNYGKWEDDYYEAKKEWIVEWKKKHKTRSLSDKVENNLALQDFLDDKQKEWDKTHSIILDSEDSVIFGRRKIPAAKYKNEDWEKYVDRFGKDENGNSKFEQYVKKWINFKASKENNIMGAKSYRLPQMSGSTVATLRQHIDREGFFKGVSRAIFPRLRTAIVRGLDAREFGTDDTYNEKEEAWYDEAYLMEAEKIHRLPIYGVRKYTKEDRKTKLSTNIVNTMMAYCVMANTYDSFYEVVDTLDIAKHVLKAREKGINGIRSDKTSRAYTRFDKFLDKQVYNLRTQEFKKAKWINGVINGANAAAAFMYLGGNVPGGAVNLGTGLIQLFSEAAVGEWMSLKSLIRAESIYLKSSPAMLAEDLGGRAGIGRGLTKMSLFLDKFNALDDARTKLSSYEDGIVGWAQRVLNPMDVAMAPYSVGEKLMQGVTYAAIAMDTEIYNMKDKSKKSTAWDEYKTVKAGNGVNKYSLELSDGWWVRPTKRYSLDSIEKHYVNLKSLQAKLEKLQQDLNDRKTTGTLSSFDFGEQRYKDALTFVGFNSDSDITGTNIESALYKIKFFFNQVEWNSDAESDLINKAREVNDRLHGVYNKHDKTAFSNNAITNAVLVMKNYAVGYIQAKFAPDHYSEILGQDVEGSFNTLAKVWLLPYMGKNSNTKESILQAMRFTILPHSKATAKMMEEVGFSQHQVCNMKRNLQDMIKILMLGLLKFISYLPPEEDKKRLDKLLESSDTSLFEDIYIRSELLRQNVQSRIKVEDHEKLFGMIYYFSMRLQFEQDAYILPWKMYTEFHNLFNLFPVSTSAIKDMCKLAVAGVQQLEDNWTKEDPEDKSNPKVYYQNDDPRGSYLEGDSKFWTMVKKRTPYWKSVYWWNHPYEAAQSFEYAARLRAGK